MILSIDDLRELAKRRIPRAIFDYADGGAYEERTMRRNSADLDAMSFRQRVMVDVSNISLATTFARFRGLDAAGHRADRALPDCSTPTVKYWAQERRRRAAFHSV